MVELLIVIGIIIFLMAALGLVAMNALGGAKIAATKATLSKVQGLLQQRLDSVMNKAPDPVLVESLTPRFAGNRKIAEAIARKYILRQAFPQTWTELTTYFPNLLLLSKETAPMATTPATESAEVLLFLLTRANVMGYPPEGVDVFSSAEILDTDGNGKMELVDNWGHPLRFYRWPTRLIRGGPYAPGGFTPSAAARAMMPALPTTATDLAHDLDDKFGLLQVNNVAWRAIFSPVTAPPIPAAHINYFENGLAPAPSAMAPSPFYQLGAFHTLETTSLPLIVSAGSDGVTGLFEPTDTVNFGNLAAADPTQTNNTFDNISNYSTRSGGR